MSQSLSYSSQGLPDAVATTEDSIPQLPLNSPLQTSTTFKQPCPSPKLAKLETLHRMSEIQLDICHQKPTDYVTPFKECLEVSIFEEEKQYTACFAEVRELVDREGAEKIRTANVLLGKELHRQLLEENCMGSSTRATSCTNLSSASTSLSPMKSTGA